MSEAQEQIPASQVQVDWAEFRRLPPGERRAFVEFVENMERGNRFNRSGTSAVAWASIGLSEYADYPAFVSQLKRVGKSFYEGKKAEKIGYYSKFFDERTYVADIVAVNTSSAERQGRPMSDSYQRTVEQLGGYPDEIRPPSRPAQSVFWRRNFGTFRPSAGHRQGSLLVDEQLAAYLTVDRYGDFAHYHIILGHHDFLQDGVVHKMHLDFVKAVLDQQSLDEAPTDRDPSLAGLKYLCYGGYFGLPGLTRWKKSNLFCPRYFRFDISPAIEEPEAEGHGKSEVVGFHRSWKRQETGNRMIRIGDYDAFAKWEFLCRYWEDRDSVSDPGVDKFGRPRLSRWQATAVESATGAIFDYIRFRANAATDGATGAAECAISQEMALLWKEFGNGGLAAMTRQFAEAITLRGLANAGGDRFSPELSARLKEVFKRAALDRLQWTEEAGEIPTIDILRAQRSTAFPSEMIRGKRNALCVFCARFYGRDDVIHVHDVCPDHVTLVDDDAQSMADMKLIYPGDWSFVTDDYRRFFQRAAEVGAKFDLIICDEWPSMAKEVAWDCLPTIMSICSDMLIINYTTEMLDELNVSAHELRRLSTAVSQRTGIDVAFSKMSPLGANACWAVIHKL